MSKILIPPNLLSQLAGLETRLHALETTPNVSLKFLTSIQCGGTATVTGAGPAAAWVDMTNNFPTTALINPITLDRPSRILALMSATITVTGAAGFNGQVRGLIRNLGSPPSGQPIITGVLGAGLTRVAQWIFYSARGVTVLTPQVGYFASGIIAAGNYEAAIQATLDNAAESLSASVSFDVFAVS